MNNSIVNKKIEPGAHIPSSFTLIAGPCSAESLEQLHESASMINRLKEKGICVDYLRAGVWKPRTRPGNFEGYGSQALSWIKQVRKEFPSINVLTEVASREHIEACLESGIRNFWIGARTVSNPFAVQQIADILKGSGIKVMVKNPVSPDLGLWIGALERLEKVGLEVEAIHRGFATYSSGPYRNTPLWELPIELKRRCYGLKVLCDPSHIAGCSKLIPEISQLAIDLEMDGLMVEVHPNPKTALSDSQQQLDSKEYESLLNSLVFKKQNSVSLRLNTLRHLIDQTDLELISILSRRFELVRQMGEIKKEENMSVLQMERWKEVLLERAKWANELNINEDFIRELFRCIHAEAVNIQK